jgi:hypothetical protein
MDRFGPHRRRGYAALAVALVLGSVVAVAAAQAAPSKKNYTVQVAVANDAVSHQDFTVTVKNDGSSNTTLGSVNVTLPTGFTADAATTPLAGWTPTIADTAGTSTIQLRSARAADALAAGSSIVVSVHVATPALPTTCGDASWSSTAKQSNDYNGTNNWFTLLTAQSDMKPLGSFEIDPIGTAIGVAPFFTPAILLRAYMSSTTAYDTCHNVKTNYDGAVLTHHGLTGATITPATSLSWASGIGSVNLTPAISETDNTITVKDTATKVAGTSNFFDTQQKICTLADLDPCAWSNNKGIDASALKPGTGSLGVGFNPDITFTCNNVTGGNLGHTVITIAPHDTPSGAYQVTLVFSKQVSGSGSANSFIFCEDKNDGSGFQQLPSCASSGTGVDCVFGQKRITGGALQVILSLLPGDPYVSGR